MRHNQEYKSPIAAMLWSAVLPGFGQLYNKDYLVAFVLMAWELAVNFNSNLNLAILHSFHGDIYKAHEMIDYKWGMFYPSIYGFSIRQAFNYAKAKNDKFLGKPSPKRTYFTGFFIGMVIGMDLGLFWHQLPFLTEYRYLKFLDSPVFNGIIFGLILAIVGNTIEKMITSKRKAVFYS